jgi:hypothetical protein
LNSSSFGQLLPLLTHYTIQRLSNDWEVNSLSYLFTFWGKLSNSIPHTLEARSSVQKAVAEENLKIVNSFLSIIDSESGLESVSSLMEEEDNFFCLLELVAPLIRLNYTTHTQCIENKLMTMLPLYEVSLFTKTDYYIFVIYFFRTFSKHKAPHVKPLFKKTLPLKKCLAFYLFVFLQLLLQ